VDWMVANMLAIKQGSLGHIRYILKDGLKYLPLYGYYFRQVRLSTLPHVPYIACSSFLQF
jgi:1-acyl-sn-glycerol-3-phosphate acyltransferase